jgi:hypothetical protein
LKLTVFQTITFIGILTSAIAQTNITQQNQSWWAYISQTRISNRISVGADGHLNPTAFAMLAGYVNYHFKTEKNLSTAVGYAHLWIPIQQTDIIRIEQRAWGQVLLSYNKGKSWRFTHRFRCDARFREKIVNNQKTDDYNFNWRLRYMFQLRYNFPKKETDKGQYYAAIANEYLFNVGDEIVNKIRFDQNRVSLSIGYQIKNITLQVGYMNRTSKAPTRETYTMNHTLLVWVFHNFDLRKK